MSDYASAQYIIDDLKKQTQAVVDSHSVVKSVQRGSFLDTSEGATYSTIISKSINISSVNPDKSILVMSPSRPDAILLPSICGELTNATTLTFSYPNNMNSSFKFYLNWEVIEFY